MGTQSGESFPFRSLKKRGCLRKNFWVPPQFLLLYSQMMIVTCPLKRLDNTTLDQFWFTGHPRWSFFHKPFQIVSTKMKKVTNQQHLHALGSRKTNWRWDGGKEREETRNEQRDQVFFCSRYDGPRTGGKSAFRPGWTNIELFLVNMNDESLILLNDERHEYEVLEWKNKKALHSLHNRLISHCLFSQ